MSASPEHSVLIPGAGSIGKRHQRRYQWTHPRRVAAGASNPARLARRLHTRVENPVSRSPAGIDNPRRKAGVSGVQAARRAVCFIHAAPASAEAGRRLSCHELPA